MKMNGGIVFTLLIEIEKKKKIIIILQKNGKLKVNVDTVECGVSSIEFV